MAPSWDSQSAEGRMVPFPVVVLVQGSGPSDRDETIGPKQARSRDLAWGLASQGIAVLRYDKRTYVYPTKTLTSSLTLTVKRGDHRRCPGWWSKLLRGLP